MKMNDDDLLVCRPRKLSKADATRVLHMRQLSQFRTATAIKQGAHVQTTTPVDIATLFKVVFQLEMDSRVAARLRSSFERERVSILRRQQRDEPGYIYCFHDIGDPATVVKIGRTKNKPETRLSQWENTLAPESPNGFLVLLFAYKTSYNEFAELIVKQSLRCWNISNRMNPVTNTELTEYYQNNNIMALSVFVREVVRFVDTFCNSLY